MTFREREKARLVPLKWSLFSAAACDPGIYHQKRRDFCLWNDCSAENLFEPVRADAIAYFAARRIAWHDGREDATGRSLPSHHLCSSQAFCVNAWAPFDREPARLARVLADLGLPVAEVLPFELDAAPGGGEAGCVAFEWIGEKNYLGERSMGRVASDDGRSRGQGYTSADFAIRYRSTGGDVEVVVGEWKYTEEYPRDRSLRFASSGTDRLDIYGPALASPDSPIRLDVSGRIAPEALMFDPFDQLMRLQLLAAGMERAGEMAARRVRVLHVAPRANGELWPRITSPALEPLGSTVHAVWDRLVGPERFRGLATEDVLPVLARHTTPEHAQYLQTRYAPMV